jgi:death on curing protein
VSVRYLTPAHLLRLADLAVGVAEDEHVRVRDFGVLDSAAHRPRAGMFGRDAYPDVHEKAAASLHGLVSGHPLVDGNKRLGWVAAVVFLGLNGQTVDAPEDDAVHLVFEVAAGRCDVPEITDAWRAWSVRKPD